MFLLCIFLFTNCIQNNFVDHKTEFLYVQATLHEQKKLKLNPKSSELDFNNTFASYSIETLEEMK